MAYDPLREQERRRRSPEGDERRARLYHLLPDADRREDEDMKSLEMEELQLENPAPSTRCGRRTGSPSSGDGREQAEEDARKKMDLRSQSESRRAYLCKLFLSLSSAARGARSYSFAFAR